MAVATRATLRAMPDLVRFTETMTGWLGTNGHLSYDDAAREGEASGTVATFVLTVVTPDVGRMVADPQHRSPAFGCVLAPALSPEPLSVTEGHLDLFADATPDGRILHMRYGLLLRAQDGQIWFLRGCKEVCRRRWYPTFLVDTTRLYTDVWRGASPTGPPAFRGILIMGPVGFLGQLAAFRGSGRVGGLRGIVRYLVYYVSRVARVVSGPRTPSPRESAIDAGPGINAASPPPRG